jgi:23S rRNA pseudouridine2604 synthase
MDFPIRINKYIAHQGWASRREADGLIEKKAVLVNGTPATLGQMIDHNDTVTLAQKAEKQRLYYAYYKGRGIISHSPDEHETDIATKLHDQHGITGVYPVGRLDKDSEGLIILTNDGRVTGPLLSPDSGFEKEYDLILDKPINHWFTKHIAAGVRIEGYITKPATITTHPENPKRCRITLTEGKKHQIRRMCAALGYQVQSLKRVRVANITLGKLKPNQYRKIDGAELKAFLTTLAIPTRD